MCPASLRGWYLFRQAYLSLAPGFAKWTHYTTLEARCVDVYKRQVIAFPKVQNAGEPMSGCPETVEEKQLRELSIRLRCV